MFLNVLLPDVYQFQDLSSQDFDVLMKVLSLPSLDSLFAVSDISIFLFFFYIYFKVEYVDIWCSKLSLSLNKVPISSSVIPRIGIIYYFSANLILGPAKLTKFIDLPNTFQELLLKFMGVKCRECDTVPRQGGICLLCGTLTCIASQCCLKNDRGEAFRVNLQQISYSNF
jgi:hypothetical protein